MLRHPPRPPLTDPLFPYARRFRSGGAGSVSGVELGKDGVVSLKYESGDLVPKFRIAMADVQSPDKLNPLAGNVYSQSMDSGVVVMGYPANGSYGSVLSEIGRAHV